MVKRWSKLQAEVEDLFSPGHKAKIHCSVYRMKSQRGNTNLPRYWITVNGNIIWDYPKNTIDNTEYPYITDISEISNLLREYIDTPRDVLKKKIFKNDRWGLTSILKALDRRIIWSIEEYGTKNRLLGFLGEFK